jgi:enoyl-CoA hydratase
MADVVLTERAGGVLVIIINRPQARNAVNTAVAGALAAAVDELDQDGGLSAGVITGAGGTFCAGMDLKAFLAGERPSVAGRGFAGIVERPPLKPLIAAVEGYALAGGFEIVLACDLVVAARDATFGLPEVRRGLVAGGGGLIRLPRRVPYFLAAEWALIGGMIPAARGYEAGLVNRLTEQGHALEVATELAGQVAANGPLAVRVSKQVLAESPDWPSAEAFTRQRALTEPIRESDDAREGARAFAEKREPVWRGR